MVDRTLRKSVVCVLVAAALGVGSALGGYQTQTPPRFEGGVELVQLTVSVLDNQRRPVRGLTAEDFTVLDNGASKPIRAFTAVDIPGSQPPAAGTAVWVSDVAPDVATNQIGEEPGRLVVILMDRSIPHEAPVVTARKIATSIVDSLGPNDLAALISTSGGDPQNFTSDRTRLIASINQRDWATDSDQYPWDLEGSLEDGRCLCGICVLDTITRVAEAVRGASSRSRSLFFIGKGVIVQAPPRAPTLDPGCDRLTRDAREKMLDAVRLSNLTVHSIDPSELYTVGPQTRASSRGGPPLPEGMAARLRREAQQRETNVMLATQNTLRVLPDLTGGRTIVSRNAPHEVVPEIFRESESYYLIGFEAATDGRAERPRSIDVKVSRRGAKVSTQRQYVVPGANQTAARQLGSTSTAPDNAQPPNESLRGLLPDAAPPLRVALAAFAKGDGPNADVAVTVDVSNFIDRSSAASSLDVAIFAVDQLGRPVSSAKQAFVVTGAAAAPERPIELRTRLEVPSGDLELRVAVSEAAGDRSASVFSQLAVPAFAEERLALSHLSVDVSPAEQGAVPSVAAAPTSMRSFLRSRDAATLFAQIYQGPGRLHRLAPVSVRTRVVDIAGRVVNDASTGVTVDAFERRRFDFRADLPLKQLLPGEYLLTLTVSAEAATAERSMRFTVRQE